MSSASCSAAGEEDSAEAVRNKRAELRVSIEERQRRVREEAQELAALERQLELSGGPQKHSVEELRTMLEAVSADMELSRQEFVAAREEVAAAKASVAMLTDAKEALSERLLAILQANEEAKLQKLSELAITLDSTDEPASNGSSSALGGRAGSGSALSRAPATDEREDAFDGFDGFDEPMPITAKDGALS